MAQLVKNLPAVQETRVPSLGREDSPGEGNGNSLQCSCLKNSVVGYSPMVGHEETDMTEPTHPPTTHTQFQGLQEHGQSPGSVLW